MKTIVALAPAVQPRDILKIACCEGTGSARVS